MNKFSAIYQFVAIIFGISFILGGVMPSGLHFMKTDLCPMMSNVPSGSSHMDVGSEDCPMNKMKDHDKEMANHLCDVSIVCACDIDRAPLKTEAPILTKVKLPQVVLVATLFKLNAEKKEITPLPIYFTNSYSPPLLFLANASFLI